MRVYSSLSRSIEIRCGRVHGLIIVIHCILHQEQLYVVVLIMVTVLLEYINLVMLILDICTMWYCLAIKLRQHKSTQISNYFVLRCMLVV